MTDTDTHPNLEFVLRVYKHQQLVHSHWLSGSLVLGRQDAKTGEPPPFQLCTLADGELSQVKCRHKLVIAGTRDISISRCQALIELLGAGQARITNVSENVALHIGSDCLPPQAEAGDRAREVDLRQGPVTTAIDNGECAFRLECPAAFRGGSMYSLDLATLAPGQSRAGERAPLQELLDARSDLSATELAQWLLDTMSVFHTGSTAQEMLAHATDALADMIGLDYVAGLTYQDGMWNITHERDSLDTTPNAQVLERVLQARRSFRCLPESENSLVGVGSVVAAPILDLQGQVQGALYGDRRARSRNNGAVSELEQMVIELVAAGVANGIARLEQQTAAIRAQVQFEQFFGPMLADELNRNRELLAGRETEVTVLFCDITGFSRISVNAGPATTLSWINDVLNELSQCVVQRGGVVVDYIGDELMAMWGAPRPMDDHAQQACLAALEMKQKLKAINERWQPLVGETTATRIGINTGTALVGNTGSQLKFKYGPMGTTVNLASRLRGAAQQVKCNLLVSGQTVSSSGMLDQARRLGALEVVNIPQPIDVYELGEADTEGWEDLKRGYELSLGHFESSDFRQAAQCLSDVLMRHPQDDPSLLLLARSVNALSRGPEPKHPVWVLTSK